LWDFISGMKRSEIVENVICSKQFKSQQTECNNIINESLERSVYFGEDYFHRFSSSSTYLSHQSDQLPSVEINGQLSCDSLVLHPPLPLLSHLQQEHDWEKMVVNKKEKTKSISTLERMKKLLQVEIDDDSGTNYDKEDTKERAEKTKVIQEMLKTKVSIINDK
jgi:hypothetical protein